MELTRPLAVRQLHGAGWQVLLENPHQWHTCRSELDARFIANGLDIAHAVARGEIVGEETAQELDEATSILIQNVGRCAAERLMRDSARLARENQALSSEGR